jgi:DMSO reductase family type II enzyme chaperone
MMTFQTQELKTDSERQQANRSRMYSMIAESFRYPDSPFLDQVLGGSYQKALETLLQDLPYIFNERTQWTDNLYVPDRVKEEIEIEFCRLFEVGPGGPPCPLVEGSYRQDRKVVLKELILFYNHFGLSYAEGTQDERPDHICLEMEFLHYLVFKEVNAIQTGAVPEPYRRGQRDFISRHPLPWIPQARTRVERLLEKVPEDACMEAIRFYVSLLGLAESFLQKEIDYLNSMIG